MPKRVPSFRPTVAGPPRPPAADRHAEYNRYRRDPVLLKLYSSARWRAYRRAIRRERVLCERCTELGRVEFGTHVHHVVDPRDDLSLAFEDSNVRLWCASCHSRHHAQAARRGGDPPGGGHI